MVAARIGQGLALLVVALVALVVLAFVAAFVWYFVGGLVENWKWLAVGGGLLAVAALGAAALER